MDAYNRGYNPGIEGLGGFGSNVGTASIKAIDIPQGSEPASFYALAYTIGTGVEGIASATTVISYRGTDEPAQELVAVDFGISYFQNYRQQQIMMAAQFYDAVQASGGGIPPSNMLLTGHSLGGALAGWTAAMRSTNAVLVDNIGFNAAIEEFVEEFNLYRQYIAISDYAQAAQLYSNNFYGGYVYGSGLAPELELAIDNELGGRWNFFRGYGYNGTEVLTYEDVNSFLQNNVDAFHNLGSVATGTRSGAPYSAAILPSTVGNLLDYLPQAPVSNAIAAHGISLHVLMKYIEQEKDKPGFLDFRDVFAWALTAIYNEQLAEAAGFKPERDGGVYTASGKLLAALGYSAIDEGTRVFGDTGIRAMFDDLSGFGGRAKGNPTFLRNTELSALGPDVDEHIWQAIIDAVVQFSGEMALRKVTFEDSTGLSALNGIIGFSTNGITNLSTNPSADGNGADVMFVDLSSRKWDIGKQAGSTTLAPAYLSNWLESALVKALVTSFPVGSSNNETLDPGNFANTFSVAKMPELFSMVYGEGDTIRGWSDDRITSQYINGAAFLVGNESQQVLLPQQPGGSSAALGGSATIALGTTQGNNVVGTALNEVYLMGDGNDTVTAGGGSDIILAGAGNDTLDGGDGDDLIVGDANSKYDDRVGNDLINTGEGLDTVVGGLGDDTIIGAVKGNSTVDGWVGHNEIHGGNGNDSIDGGDGADIIFDQGSETPWDVPLDVDRTRAFLDGYDSLGNDTIYGGAGNDHLVYSGGNDTFYGGAGDDSYFATTKASGSRPSSDNLTIVLSDGSQPDQWFGHDLIDADNKAVDLVIFEGISRADVDIKYDYTAVAFGMTPFFWQPVFPFWFNDPLFTPLTHYATIGTVEIVVRATGSSLTIQNVRGVQSTTPNDAGRTYGPEAQISVPFTVQFSNAILDWPTALLDHSEESNSYSFLDSPLSSTALAALEGLEAERAGLGEPTVCEPDETAVNGSNKADYLVAGAGPQYLRGGAGPDRLVGGSENDTLDGGSGVDTASYETHTFGADVWLAAVRVDLGTWWGPGPEPDRDYLISIENIVGSSFDDSIDDVDDLDGRVLLADNKFDGAGGNDRIDARYGNDTLIGGEGDDVLVGLNGAYRRSSDGRLSEIGPDADELYGGAGNDTLTNHGGRDLLYGGEGDDRFWTGNNHGGIYFNQTIIQQIEVRDFVPDNIFGGSGIDTAAYSYDNGAAYIPLSGFLVDLVAGKVYLPELLNTSRIEGVENIVLEGGHDTVYGNAEANEFWSGGGNDLLLGGGGNDTLWGQDGHDTIFGGTGLDTVAIQGSYEGITAAYVEGGIVVSVSYVEGFFPDSGTFTIFDDVEFIRFSDVTVTYGSIASGLQTAFAVIDDFRRINEGSTTTISLFGNDLPYQASPLQLLKINGSAVGIGDVIRLASGATITVLSGGQLSFDQGGAYAWLELGETGTETISYTATDATGVQRTAELTIVVDGTASNATMVHLGVQAVFATSNATEAAGTTIANFDIGRGIVVVDDVLVDPNAPPPGVTLQEIDGDTFVIFGDDAVILSDISLSAWQYRAALRAVGGAGNENLVGTSNGELILGNGGRDTITGNGGADVLSGGTGNDWIILGDQNGVILGDDGVDDLYGGAGNDVIYGGAGNDDATSGSGHDVVYGGAGDDRLDGDGGNDTMYGGAGNDTLSGGGVPRFGVPVILLSGSDVLDGGDGFDIVDIQNEVVNGSLIDAQIDLETGWISWTRGVADERILNFEGAFGSGANDTLIGNGLANKLDGSSGNDSVLGAAGNDTITDALGDDTIYGGSGDDSIGDFDGSDVIFGGDGADWIYDTYDYATTANNDQIFGGAGNDTIYSYVGTDLIDGGDGVDLLDLSFVPAGDSGTLVNLTSGIINGTFPDTLVSIEDVIGASGNDSIVGSSAANNLSGLGGMDTLFGEAENDTLQGGSGNDWLDGGTGSDSIVGGTGDDTYVVDSASDVITELTNEGTDVVQSSVSWTLGANFENLILTASAESGSGNTAANILIGNALGNVLSGADGDDSLDGGAGNDTLFGGAGSDRVTFDVNIGDLSIAGGVNALIVTSAASGTDTVGNDVETFILDGQSFTYAQLATFFVTTTANGVVNGTASSDLINLSFVDAGGESVRDSTSLHDTVFAGAGNDTILLLSGNDLGYGGSGNDTLSGGAGNDSLVGNEGNDSLSGDVGNDTLMGFDGNDALLGGDGDDSLNGGSGADTLFGGAGNDTFSIEGTVSGDLVDEASGSGTDLVISSDSYALTSGVENLTLLEVAGSVAIGTGNELNNVITGNSGNNVLSGGAGADTLSGGAGADSLNGGDGQDSMAGGAGRDTYFVNDVGDIVFETSSSDYDSVISEVSFVLASHVENLTLVAGSVAVTGQGNGNGNILTGNEKSNLLQGMSGFDILYGGAGNDTLDGGVDGDTLHGGTGDDLYIVDDTYDQVVELANEGFDVVQASANCNLTGQAEGVENLILLGTAVVGGGNALANTITGNAQSNSIRAGAGSDTVFGGDGRDTLSGEEHDDSIHGGNGNDIIDGGVGNDSMAGGFGDDTFYVESVGDTIFESVGEGTDTVETTINYVLGANLENLILRGGTATKGTGNSLANTIYGNNNINNELFGEAGNDTLYSGAGNDTLTGGAGDDVLSGGLGNDEYIFEDAGDVIVEGLNAGTDIVRSSVSAVLAGNVEDLQLSGSAAIDGTGNVLANVLTGNSSNNRLVGMDGSDTLSGLGGADTLEGGLGDDTYLIEDASDFIVEEAFGGFDFVLSSVDHVLSAEIETLTLIGAAFQGTGNTLANLIVGTASANLLFGAEGDDVLRGGGGNDTLDGGVDNDVLEGAEGDDTYVVDADADTVTELAGGGTDTIQSTVTVTALAAEVENLMLLGSSAINGTGNTLANVLTGNTAANTLSGGSGNDTIRGGDGNDTLNGDSGSDSMEGGNGNDIYAVDNASDVVVEAAGAGTDLVNSSVAYSLSANTENLTLTGSASVGATGNASANILTGNSGANLLSGLDGNDTLSGGSGNDTLDGGLGNDSLMGGTGNDVYVIDSSADVVVEAASGGTDLVQSSVTFTLGAEVEQLALAGSTAINGTGNNVANILTGNVAANLLSGAGGNDTLFGGDGADTLDGGAGSDSLTGGAGNDTFIVDVAGDVVTELAGGGTDSVQAGLTYTLGTEVENLLLTGTSAINGTGNAAQNALTGNSANNTLSGLGGNDTLDGGAGNDSLDGGLGADILIGGAGNDVFVVDNVGDVVTEIAGGGTDRVTSSITTTLAAEVENLTLSGSTAINGTGNGLANVLTGNTGANLLSGSAGNDTISSGDGNDTLDGGLGADSMTGGLGNDTYIIDDVGDRVIEAASGGTDLVQSSITFTLGTEVENLTLTGASAINGTGNTLANLITGNGAANLLTGGSGNDTLDGGGGNDTLDGGVGNDTLIGGAGDDVFIFDVATDVGVEAAAGGTDTVQTGVSWTLAAEFERLLLTGTTGVSGTGNAAANSLTGNSGANNLSGLGGNDTILGGGGNDTLSGGLGADQFVFNSTTSGIDVVSDFNELDGGGEEGDILRFEGLRVGTFAYRGTSAFTGGSDNSEARVVGNQVLVDTNGDGTTDITITLTGLTTASQLGAGDFLFV
jgi:Ca2+-binding RTX toxin-like protein